MRNPDGSQGYTLNSKSGCKNHTPEGLCLGGLFPCYAYKLANGRLKSRYLQAYALPKDKGILADSYPTTDPFYPRFWEERLDDSLFITKSLRARLKPRGIFVCDMGELFGDWVPREWQEEIFLTIVNNPQHRFYLLTKQPQNLIKFSPFPEDCWVGVTATGYSAFNTALDKLKCVDAKVKYISIEPLLEHIHFNMERLAYCGINWLIIGACTGTKREMMNLHWNRQDLTVKPWGAKWTAQPRIEDLREIVEAADKAGIPVFLEDSLKPLIKWPDAGSWAFDSFSNMLRQELPK